MRLYLLRHGIAVDRADWAGSDEDRPLTSKGRQRIDEVARALTHRGLPMDRVLSSPCLRARQTAEIVKRRLPEASTLGVDQRLAPGFNPHQLERLLLEHADVDSLVLVGHEPDFSELIQSMIGGGRFMLKKSGIACLQITPTQPRQATLLWLVPPKLLI